MTDTRRLELHTKLTELLGSNYVYYQPPATVNMHYPAIRYNLSAGKDLDANNKTYLFRKRYTVTFMDWDPDAQWLNAMLDTFDYCSFDRWYAADNLNHWVFDLYW